MVSFVYTSVFVVLFKCCFFSFVASVSFVCRRFLVLICCLVFFLRI